MMLNRPTGAGESAMATSSSIRHFLDLHEIDADTLRAILDHAHAMKAAGGKRVPKKLRPAGVDDCVLVMIFEKPSTRTRVSFDIGMRQLGGQVLMLNQNDLQLGRGESIADTARVLSGYADIVMIRANSHDTVLGLAQHSSIPIINGLTDKSHPCQIMADILTFEETVGPITGRTVAWVGDGNNVAISWVHAAARFGFELRLACPKELYPDKDVLAWAKREKAKVAVMTDPNKAVAGADCIVTDTWVSMGQTGAAQRKKLLTPYRVDGALMAKAAKDAVFMHCLPAYRGNEVTEEVLEGPQSVVFQEAENRLHAQKAILAWCLSGNKS